MRACRRAALLAACVLAACALDAAARGGRGGGGRGGGGFSRGGPAGRGSMGGYGGSPGGGGYRTGGPAAGGTFGGTPPAGSYPGRSSYDGGRAATAVPQRPAPVRETRGLNPPDAVQQGRAERQDQRGQDWSQRQDQRDQAREDWQQHADERREDWQEFADDVEDDDRYYGGYVAAGAAIGAAAAYPPGWTYACVPTVVTVGTTTYYQCGSAWYTRAYGGGEVAYVMSNPPPGY